VGKGTVSERVAGRSVGCEHHSETLFYNEPRWLILVDMLFLFHFRCQVCASESFDAGGERRREQLEAMLQIMADLDDNGCQEMQFERVQPG
jgi:hypothetical protein